MAELRLPVPRVEALVFCGGVTIEDGRTYDLRQVCDRVIMTGPGPATVTGSLFVKFAASPGTHTSQIDLVEVATGDVVMFTTAPAGNSSASDETGGSIGVLSLTLFFRTPGIYAFRLFVDDHLLGYSAINVVRMPL